MVNVNGMKTKSKKTNMKPSLSAIMSHLKQYRTMNKSIIILVSPIMTKLTNMNFNMLITS